MEVVQEKLKVLRTKLDSIPILQKAEVSNKMRIHFVRQHVEFYVTGIHSASCLVYERFKLFE